MGWRDLLQTEERQTITAPWVGGRSLQTYDRHWQIEHPMPHEHGWHAFSLGVRMAHHLEPEDPPFGVLKDQVRGYLLGDHIVPDSVQVRPSLQELTQSFEKVHLIEPGLDRFVRVIAGRFFENGPLIYESLEMPLGPEEEVLDAFLDRKDSVDNITGVVPALDAAFRIETWRRAEVERIRREEQERREQEEREAREREEREERRRHIVERMGDGAGRREIAAENFEEAARSALAVGGAAYLDHRRGVNQNERVVRYRLMNRRFECVCHARTLRIIDAGVCLTDERTGERGDTRFTLESLPAVVRQASDEGVLVIFRHG